MTQQQIPRYVYRFMSRSELLLLMDGYTLRNTAVMANLGYHTDAVGYCFGDATDKPRGPMAFYKIRRDYHHLSGIVNPYCVVVFRTDETAQLTPATGEYGSPGHFLETALFPEWCATEYSAEHHGLTPVYVSFHWLAKEHYDYRFEHYSDVLDWAHIPDPLTPPFDARYVAWLGRHYLARGEDIDLAALHAMSDLVQGTVPKHLSYPTFLRESERGKVAADAEPFTDNQ